MPRIVLVDSPFLSAISGATNTAQSLIQRRDELKRQELEEREQARRQAETDARIQDLAERRAERLQFQDESRAFRQAQLKGLGAMTPASEGQAQAYDPDPEINTILTNAHGLLAETRDPRLQEGIYKQAATEIKKIEFNRGYEVEDKAIEDALRDGKITPEMYKRFKVDSERSRKRGAVAGAVHDDVLKAVQAYDNDRQLTKDWTKTIERSNKYIEDLEALPGSDRLPLWKLRDFVNRYDFKDDGGLSTRQGELKPDAFFDDLQEMALEVFASGTRPLTEGRAATITQLGEPMQGPELPPGYVNYGAGPQGPELPPDFAKPVPFKESPNKHAFMRSLGMTLDNVTEEEIVDLARRHGIDPTSIDYATVKEFLETDIGDKYDRAMEAGKQHTDTTAFERMIGVPAMREKKKKGGK